MNVLRVLRLPGALALLLGPILSAPAAIIMDFGNDPGQRNFVNYYNGTGSASAQADTIRFSVTNGVGSNFFYQYQAGFNGFTQNLGLDGTAYFAIEASLQATHTLTGTFTMDIYGGGNTVTYTFNYADFQPQANGNTVVLATTPLASPTGSGGAGWAYFQAGGAIGGIQFTDSASVSTMVMAFQLDNFQVVPVPEPSGLAALALAFAGFQFRRGRRPG